MEVQRPGYTNMNGGEHGDVSGDDVSTEPSESLMGNGHKTWDGLQAPGSARQSLWRRCYSATCSLQGLLNTVLLFVILGLLVDRRWHKERPGHFEGNGDLTGFAPRCKFVPSLANEDLLSLNASPTSLSDTLDSRPTNQNICP